jgi:hypothetical protein
VENLGDLQRLHRDRNRVLPGAVHDSRSQAAGAQAAGFILTARLSRFRSNGNCFPHNVLTVRQDTSRRRFETRNAGHWPEPLFFYVAAQTNKVLTLPSS